ncbi:MAG: hypothetical protein CVU57_23065 [Deltaproteobacteria bacterium HGW-Deltaproteobacteria-15]|nr:MAG: hypothetical protein CVU57_23065 [Deltaproteobacteria bacterium HGW-Deltaproteobacteria-15]
MHQKPLCYLVCLITAMLWGCAGTPPSRFYGLSPMPPLESSPFEETRSLTVGVTRLTLPDFLDKPQIATRLGPNEIRYDEFNRWAEPLKDNLSRVLAENLSVLLGPDRVLVSANAGALLSDYQVWVEVIQFEAGPGGDFSLTAQWSLFRQEGKKVLIRKRFNILEQAGGSDYVAMVAAGSRAVAALSREIAGAIRAMHQESALLDVHPPGQDGAKSRF